VLFLTEVQEFGWEKNSPEKWSMPPTLAAKRARGQGARNHFEASKPSLGRGDGV